jgi:hypothetical protein
VIHYYIRRDPIGTWRAYSDADDLPVCEPTTETEASRVARELGALESQRAWDAASPGERWAMSDTSGT